jgi:hypothetical protein
MTKSESTTILATLAAEAPFRATNSPLTSQVTIQGQPYLAIGYDNGNDAAKVALLTDQGRLITLRIPTAYRTAQIIRGGTGVTTYRHDGPPFWIGAAALDHEGDALPIGPTPQRLADPRQRAFIAAVLVEALVQADYPPGSYDLALGIAVPNIEIVREAQGDKLGVAEPTRAALKTLRGVPQTVRRTDQRGRESVWMLTVRHLIPQAQSIGTFLAWSRTPMGSTVTDVEALTVIDIGGGDLQRTDISVNPYRMATQHLGTGTVGIARALATAFPQLGLNDVQAQQALVSRSLRIAGRRQDITAQVTAAIATHGQDVIGRVLPILQQQQRYVLITGGGAILLRDLLSERAAAVGKAQPDDYALIDPRHAALLNAVGALFAVLFAATKRG